MVGSKSHSIQALNILVPVENNNLYINNLYIIKLLFKVIKSNLFGNVWILVFSLKIPKLQLWKITIFDHPIQFMPW